METLIILWLTLTGPDGQPIEINPDHIVSLRPPRGTEHFHKDVHCLLHTVDGRVVTVVETCDEISKRMEE